MSRIHISTENDTIFITIRERFDFSGHQAFRRSYRDYPNFGRFVIDMTDVNYMDSAALGMMLILREHAGKHSGSVKVINCNPDILKLLEIAKLDQVLDIRAKTLPTH